MVVAIPAETITIRAAREADKATIRRMIIDARLDPTTMKWQNFLVAEHHSEIVGIGQIKPYKACEELGSLVVREDFRKQGIARRLIVELEARAGRPLYLLCEYHMQGFYAQFGYERITYWQAPRPLRMKLTAVAPFRLFGISVVVMRKG